MNKYKNTCKLALMAVLLLWGNQLLFAQKVVRYELYVKDSLVTYAGKEKELLP
ncbi:hypothetical protein LWM68_45310 [Niabella sp. W65]|nr:hypothetical protein [Niabella sp. W65]MCH7369321.1 hypothetical protein [Niabella sp. W65]ULT44862.1 hypothetical protein KRR40_17010 [Niabella sp. I65]